MIAIAGGSGFFGLNTARCLAERGQEVLLIQRHRIEPPPLLAPFWNKQVKQAIGSILDLSFLIGLVKTYSIDSIIHAAHMTQGMRPDPRTKKSGEALHQLLEVQIVGIMNCLEAARLMNLRRVTFTSSVDLYRGLPHQCEVWHEDAYLPPLSFSEIGNSKRAMEQICFLYHDYYGLSVASLRIGGNYGPACGSIGINEMIHNALEGKKIEIPKLPSNRRTHPVYAKDTAEATCLVHLADSLKHYIYNVADGTHPTMQEIAEVVKEVIPNADIQLGPPGEKVEIRKQSMDRMKDELGFIPKTVKEGVAAYVDFLKEGKY
jgi:nucleoside-diphosphate-sugar epimerase